jgi:hypothetical protein
LPRVDLEATKFCPRLHLSPPPTDLIEQLVQEVRPRSETGGTEDGAACEAGHDAAMQVIPVTVRRVVDRRWMPLPPSGGRDDHG